jgi:NADPH-dependent 2,4-dienoyl-CoA reductase/sulfur reductase-like enzyme/nitrite reductase/ring-hydroxylating ferredoxin subunit
MGAPQQITGPDFAQGVLRTTLADGATLSGRVGDAPVLLSRRGDAFFAVGGVCTHYGAHLADGVVDGDIVHCPWHHACFDLRSGEATAAPAIAPLERWRVDIDGDRIFVRSPLEEAPAKKPRSNGRVRRIVIVGGGAAGFAAAEMLRRRGYDGALTVLSEDGDAPVDRPNLSKDYLAGEAPDEWIPLRDDAFYRDHDIDLRLATKVVTLNVAKRVLGTASGDGFTYDRLLLATGATPIRPQGYEHSRVHTLRSLGDAKAIIKTAETAKHAIVVGAGFIGLETAASLRHRGVEVDVVAPEAAPMLKTLGEEVSHAIQHVHEKHGVRFHFGERANGFDGERLKLARGGALAADLIILGLGVRPNVELAEQAGLKVANGVEVDAYLQTSNANVFAAGDIARYPDPFSGTARVEHWVVAERQGQTAALNMLGAQRPFTAAPFFWSNHYDLRLHYVGYAPSWDRVEIDGDVNARDLTARYFRNGHMLAAVSAGRDRENLTLQIALDEARRGTQSV